MTTRVFSDWRRNPEYWFGAFLVIYGIFLALAGRGDLWFDEIWSLQHSRHPLGVYGILFEVRHDNNHLLNTLWLYAIGEDGAALAYRSLAMGSGLVALAAAFALGRSFGHGLGWVAALLIGASYPLAVYFSEARGYAPALAGSLVAWWMLQKIHRPKGRTWWTIFGYWWATATAILSHPGAGIVLVSLGVYSLLFLLLEGGLRKKTFGWLAAWHGPPAFLMISLYYFIWSRVTIGGGPPVDPISVVGETLCYLTALPLQASVWAAGLVLLSLGWFLYVCWRSDRPLGWFFFILLLAGPLLYYLMQVGGYSHPRYYVIFFPFYYLLAVRTLGEWREKYPRWQWLLWGVLGAWVLGQMRWQSNLLENGRGRYQEALQVILQLETERQVWVTMDQAVRNLPLFYYHAKPWNRGEHRPRLIALDENSPLAVQADWHLQTVSGESPTPDWTVDAWGRLLCRAAIFPSTQLSGWTWVLYRRCDTR